LETQLGEGGFGAAWEATDIKSTGRERLVVKFAHESTLESTLQVEVEMAQRLDHPNVCACIAYGRAEDGRLFVVMEYGGTAIQDIVVSDGPFEVRSAVNVIRQIARGLDYVHSEDILHLDVNPGNVLVDERGHARLSDFGISKVARAAMITGGHVTMVASQYFAHPGYGAPEISVNQARRGSDQYSLALVFRTMVEGELYASPPPPRGLAKLKKSQNEAVARALSLSPSERFPTCSAFADALSTV